ncbi:polysaccharide biosynthesis/export family protein [Croceicoccus bisphenolivorans]|uniref:polysaccharide biosynthesis/export family protein n=1 Tax=Croceicoccus bisphenolivorans TaxID=1783232 RepID=UPI000829E7FC|nr:polysaccharide biosynthesis/export family protein [Croceicoccus bisphenolivorans]
MAYPLRRHGPFVLFAAAVLTGCGPRPPIGAAPSITVTDLTTLPAPDRGDANRLRALDQINVRVLQDQTLDGTYIVDEAGLLDFPYIGLVPAASRGPQDLADDIARRLDGRFVIDPQVVVMPVTPVAATVSMGGEVAKPGNYAQNDATTLLRAVNAAGGRGEFAKRDEVLIFRKVQGVQYIGVYDLGAIERGNYADPSIYPGDIVMVGDSPFWRRLSGMLTVLPLLTTSAILIDRLGK